MLIPIIAVEALLRTDGALPVNLKFLFEGQEEIGSPQLSEFLKINREVFGCDVILNADSGQWSEDQPSLLTSLRGLCGLQVDVTGADSDLHSGMYGGLYRTRFMPRLPAGWSPIRIRSTLTVSLKPTPGKIFLPASRSI